MGRKKKVMTEDEFEFDVDPSYMDLDETKMELDDLFDDDDDGYIEPYGWES